MFLTQMMTSCNTLNIIFKAEYLKQTFNGNILMDDKLKWSFVTVVDRVCICPVHLAIAVVIRCVH
ncbi:hypothetical protein BLOT_000777 [Blomia tropicalis]|nr:hypothetical protein BLOT_000777 [Blomia tropicalis]